MLERRFVQYEFTGIHWNIASSMHDSRDSAPEFEATDRVRTPQNDRTLRFYYNIIKKWTCNLFQLNVGLLVFRNCN
jgi:hypothetical protein